MIMSAKPAFEGADGDLALIKEFEDVFGPDALRLVIQDMFGVESPLVGKFEATAHKHLLKYLMHRALGHDEKFEKRAFYTFALDLEKQRREKGLSNDMSDRVLYNEMAIECVERTMRHIMGCDDIENKWYHGVSCETGEDVITEAELKKPPASLPDTEIPEDHIQQRFDIDPSRNPPERTNG